MENQNAEIRSSTTFQSSIGSIVDVATPAKRRLRALGLLWSLITLFPFVIINYLIVDFVTSPEPILSGHPIYLLGAALMPLMGWFALGSATGRYALNIVGGSGCVNDSLSFALVAFVAELYLGFTLQGLPI
jgi:hypothetical protein